MLEKVNSELDVSPIAIHRNKLNNSSPKQNIQNDIIELQEKQEIIENQQQHQIIGEDISDADLPR